VNKLALNHFVCVFFLGFCLDVEQSNKTKSSSTQTKNKEKPVLLTSQAVDDFIQSHDRVMILFLEHGRDPSPSLSLSLSLSFSLILTSFTPTRLIVVYELQWLTSYFSVQGSHQIILFMKNMMKLYDNMRLKSNSENFLQNITIRSYKNFKSNDFLLFAFGRMCFLMSFWMFLFPEFSNEFEWMSAYFIRDWFSFIFFLHVLSFIPNSQISEVESDERRQNSWNSIGIVASKVRCWILFVSFCCLNVITNIMCHYCRIQRKREDEWLNKSI
jgi:hypothetical protein